MNCHSAAHLLDLYAEGRLSARRMASVARHLQSCPACRANAAPPAATRTAGGARAPLDLKARLAAASVAASPASAAAAGPSLPLWPTEGRGVALAAAALLLIAGMIAVLGAPSQSDGRVAAAVEEP